MAELQVLFHNPESLDDADLKAVRNRIRLHKLVQLGAGAGVLGLAFRLTKNPYMLAPAFEIGYGLGNPLAKLVNNSLPWALSQDKDVEIMRAFESRYIYRTQNATGYGNNALNAASHTTEPNARYKKPY